MIDNLDGFTYLMNSSQNPGYVGYIAGLPSLDGDNREKNDK